MQHIRPQSAVLKHFSLLVELPTHARPPLAGAGLVHVLVYEIVPCPHGTEHGEGADHSLHWPLVTAENGQRMVINCGCTNSAMLLIMKASCIPPVQLSAVEHGSVLSLRPTQSRPPLAGAGLVHVRV
jgi:hypothetical protein